MEQERRLAHRYRLVERLGIGGMSEVWRGYDEVLGRPVAVKMLCGRYSADATTRHLIRTEARAVARLSHPHVTNVYDYGETAQPDGTRLPFVVMEFLDGVPLDQQLVRGPLPWAVGVRIAAEVASALAAAHARGLVHRDVKPANVMITAAGAKVVDFGIAALVGQPADNAPVLLGTPGYLAPERLHGSAVTAASDVYALGLLIYRVLAGTLPWQVDTVTRMIEAHCYTEPAPLPPIDGLPPAVAEVCARCLAKAPAERPSSAHVARVLAAAVGVPVLLPRTAGPDGSARAEPDGSAPGVEGTTDPFGPTAILAIGAGLGSTAALAGADAGRPGSTAPRRGRRPAAGADRRVRTPVLAVAAMGAALLLVVGWSAAGRHPSRPAAAAAGQHTAAVGTAAVDCAVRYLTRSDADGRFAVDVTVVNTSGQPTSRWTLRFAFPAGQKLLSGTGAEWSQADRWVTVHGAGAVAPGGTQAASFTGGYQTANPLPLEFTVNDHTCAATVAGATATGVPQQVSNPAPPAKAGHQKSKRGNGHHGDGGNGDGGDGGD